MKVAPVQRDAKKPKRLDQSAFEVDGDNDVASAKDGLTFNALALASICSRTRR